MKFKLIKANIYDVNKDISSLKIMNDDYIVAFNYFGNYMKDRENHTIDMQCLSFSVKPKVNGNGMPMMYSAAEDDIFINLLEYPRSMLDDAGIEKLLQCIHIAKETKSTLLHYLRMIKNGEIIDIKNEFATLLPGEYTPPELPERFRKIAES